MKGEILFRGQRYDKKQWVEGDLIHGVGLRKGKMYILPLHANLASLEGCDPLDGYNAIPETIGQFTGLTDKNGTKIFEGDIIKAPSGRLYVVIWSTWIHDEKRNKFLTDRYEFTGWCISKDGINPCDTLDWETLQGEVVGNVHDNPELLK